MKILVPKFSSFVKMSKDFELWFQDLIEEYKRSNTLLFYPSTYQNYSQTIFNRWFENVVTSEKQALPRVYEAKPLPITWDKTIKVCNNSKVPLEYMVGKKRLGRRDGFIIEGLKGKTISIDHENTCMIKGEDPYKYYTNEFVMIDGNICRWERDFYRKIFL